MTDPAELEKLYETLIRQAEYPGGVCPTERNLMRLVTGEMSEAERGRAEAHLAECPGCREVVDALRAEARWFSEHEADLWDVVAASAAEAGLEAWAPSPPAALVEGYLTDAVPETEAGNRFRQYVERAAKRSARWRDAIEQIRAALARRVVITLADLKQGATDAQEALQALLTGLAEEAAPAMRPVAAIPGWRGTGKRSINGYIVDAQGIFVLDQDGKPASVPFAVVQAEIATDGRLVLDLSAGTRDYWATPGRTYCVQARIDHGLYRLLLPRETIRADGRVTFVANVGRRTKPLPIPISGISITVMVGEPT